VAVEVFANLPLAVVASGGTGSPAGGTTETWTVASSAAFPAVSASATPPTQCHVADISANTEIITVTNITGNTWTVTRGAEGTTPVAHVAGFTVYQVTTAGFLNGVAQTSGSFTMTGPLNVVGTAVSQLVYIEQDGSAGHCLTLNLAGTGGTSQAALNAVSANSAFSCVEVTGVETNRGTVKIAHKGYADGSDASAAAISVDLQTVTGGSTGTAAQGLFITSTTDNAPGGNPITVRYNSLDQFVVKSTGRVAIGNIAIGHTPAGQLELAQMDTSTVGLVMTAIASGTDMVNLKDSSGNLRFQVNNAGNTIMRANAFATTSLQVGSASGDFGGGTSCISIKHATDPTTNPTGGGIIYVDSTGHLCYRGSSSTITQIAPA
jgi:DNA-binding transcriptional regulator YdaS (Cro superfamily)